MGKIQSGHQDRARTARPDVEIRICRVELGRWEEHTPLPDDAKSPAERDAAWERDLGAYCMTKSRALSLGAIASHPAMAPSTDAGSLSAARGSGLPKSG